VGRDVIFYETAIGEVPAADCLDACPAKVRGTIMAVLDVVAAAPPPSFVGGGKWEAIHGSMGGYYAAREVCVYRLDAVLCFRGRDDL